MSEAESVRRGATGAETIAWVLAGVGAAILAIALLIEFNGDDGATGVGIGGALVSIALIPALLLTGIRQLVNPAPVDELPDTDES